MPEAIDLLATRRSVPAPIARGQRFTALAAGWLNTCGLTSDGAIYCWGGMHGTGLDRLGGTEPPIAFTPERVPGPERYRQVVSGHGQVCALNTSGRAFCWGGNQDGARCYGAFEKTSAVYLM